MSRRRAIAPVSHLADGPREGASDTGIADESAFPAEIGWSLRTATILMDMPQNLDIHHR
jgi:hypothetical protein